MAQGGFFQPAGAGLRHTMRFLQKRSGDMMPRGEFVRKILRGVVKVDPVGVFCMQVNLAVRGFDVSFVSGVAFEAAMKRCKEAEDEEPLCSFNVESLERRSFKVVTTHLYNPYVSDEMVAGFLSRYGKVQSGVRYLRDEDGIWTGKRQFRVLLNEDPDGFDGLEHPPAYFAIGPDRGYLFYSRQPLFCRQCRQFGHMAGSCGQGVCRNCGERGHMAAACPKPRKCHSCGQEGHEQRDCPGKEGGRSYADAAAGREGAPRKGPQDLRPLEEVLQEVRAAREKSAGEAPAAVAEEGAAGAPAAVEVAAEDPAVEKAAAATPAEEEEAQAAEAEAEAAGMEVDEASRRRQRGSDGSAENSSDPDCWTARAGKKKKRKGMRKAETPGAVPSPAASPFSGLPPSGTVRLSNSFDVLEVSEEQPGPSGVLTGAAQPGPSGVLTGAAPALPAQLKGGAGESGAESPLSEEHVFSPPRSPNDSPFLALDSGDFAGGTVL